MLWINPMKRFRRNDLNFQFEKIKVPFCDEIIKFLVDNNNLYADQSTKPIADFKEVLVDHIDGLERDFEVLENISSYISTQNLELRAGVRSIDKVDCSLHYLNDEYTLVFFTGFDRRYKAYKYGLINFKKGNKHNSILDAEIIFNNHQIDLEYTICDYFTDLFSLMNDASNINQLDELHDNAEKTILKVFRIDTKHDLYKDSEYSEFYGFYGLEPYVFLRDKYQLYIRNKIKLELRDKKILNFNEDHVELVRISRLLKSLIDERKENIELMGEDIYTTRCNQLKQERRDLITKLHLEESQLELMLS